MEDSFANIAPKRFMEGYSCSESIVRAGYELGLVPEGLVSCATSFSGGMSSKCLCGAVAGAQIIIGYIHGKTKDNTARILAKEFYDRFTQKNKVACCRVLSGKFLDFHSKERKENCANLVEQAAKILDEILKESDVKV